MMADTVAILKEMMPRGYRLREDNKRLSLYYGAEAAYEEEDLAGVIRACYEMRRVALAKLRRMGGLL